MSAATSNAICKRTAAARSAARSTPSGEVLRVRYRPSPDMANWPWARASNLSSTRHSSATQPSLKKLRGQPANEVSYTRDQQPDLTRFVPVVVAMGSVVSYVEAGSDRLLIAFAKNLVTP